MQLGRFRGGSGAKILQAYLRILGRELGAVGIRLVAYVGALALLALVAMRFLPVVHAESQSRKSEKPSQWVAVERAHPVFAVSFQDVPNSVYRALRDSNGGRRDVITLDGNGRSAVVEIYRPGRELTEFTAPQTEVANRMAALGTIESVESAPALETRFGSVSLVDFTLVESGQRRGCVGFVRPSQEPPLQISGWLCNAEPGMVARTAIACAFDKLTLLSAGGDPKLQLFFAEAERKEPHCINKRVRSVTAGRPQDWIDGRQAAKLRGTDAR